MAWEKPAWETAPPSLGVIRGHWRSRSSIVTKEALKRCHSTKTVTVRKTIEPGYRRTEAPRTSPHVLIYAPEAPPCPLVPSEQVLGEPKQRGGLDGMGGVRPAGRGLGKPGDTHPFLAVCTPGPGGGVWGYEMSLEAQQSWKCWLVVRGRKSRDLRNLPWTCWSKHCERRGWKGDGQEFLQKGRGGWSVPWAFLLPRALKPAPPLAQLSALACVFQNHPCHLYSSLEKPGWGDICCSFSNWFSANIAIGLKLDEVLIPLKSFITKMVNLDIFLLFKDGRVSLNVSSWLHFQEVINSKKWKLFVIIYCRWHKLGHDRF